MSSCTTASESRVWAGWTAMSLVRRRASGRRGTHSAQAAAGSTSCCLGPRRWRTGASPAGWKATVPYDRPHHPAGTDGPRRGGPPRTATSVSDRGCHQPGARRSRPRGGRDRRCAPGAGHARRGSPSRGCRLPCSPFGSALAAYARGAAHPEQPDAATDWPPGSPPARSGRWEWPWLPSSTARLLLFVALFVYGSGHCHQPPGPLRGHRPRPRATARDRGQHRLGRDHVRRRRGPQRRRGHRPGGRVLPIPAAWPVRSSSPRSPTASPGPALFAFLRPDPLQVARALEPRGPYPHRDHARCRPRP